MIFPKIGSLYIFNGHFPGVLGFAGIRMFPFWISLAVVVTTGATRRAKLQSKCQFLQAGCPSCSPTYRVKALKGIWRKKIGRQTKPESNSSLSLNRSLITCLINITYLLTDLVVVISMVSVVYCVDFCCFRGKNLSIVCIVDKSGGNVFVRQL